MSVSQSSSTPSASGAVSSYPYASASDCSGGGSPGSWVSESSDSACASAAHAAAACSVASSSSPSADHELASPMGMPSSSSSGAPKTSATGANVRCGAAAIDW